MAKRRHTETVFVGRESNLDQIESYFADDQVWLINIFGVTGIGKSSLLEQVHALHLSREGSQVLHLNLNAVSDPLPAIEAIAEQFVDSDHRSLAADFEKTREKWLAVRATMTTAFAGQSLSRKE